VPGRIPVLLVKDSPDGERLVYDGNEPCPYLPDQVSRTPLRLQLSTLEGSRFDELLEQGDRRVGRMLYRTACPSCRACEPLRIPVDLFTPSRSHRRILRRNEDLRVEVGPAIYSAERLALFNRHKRERGLARREQDTTQAGYEGWFVRSCVETVEMRYLVGDRLVGVGIVDLGERDSSSVYFYFDPDEGRRSLGTLSTLFEVEWLRRRGGRYHYLGLYVADCRHLVYKAAYFPHQRRVDGAWQQFAAPPPSPSSG
jgi:leucyl-tRNA---protein transferase